MQSQTVARPLACWGFLIGVEIVEGGKTTPQQVADRLTDNLSYMDDVGKVEVETLGELDIYDNNGNPNQKENQNEQK